MPGGHAARSAARAFRAVQEGRPSHSRDRPANPVTRREADGTQDAVAGFVHEQVYALKFTQTAIPSLLAQLL